MLNIVDVLGTISKLFYSDQRRNRNKSCLHAGLNLAPQCAFALAVEIEGFGDKYVYGNAMMLATMEGQHQNAVALNPMLALPRIRKLLSSHGNHRLISDRRKRLEGFDDIVSGHISFEDEYGKVRVAVVTICRSIKFSINNEII